MKPERLAVQHVAAVEAAAEVPWLVEGLWLEQGVGLLGGHPKSCKSWLALDMALSVASRTPVLGRYPVPRGGGVLVFAAEDSPPMVRARFAGLAAARGVDLARAPIQLVLERSLRLESSGDQARLLATLEELRPVLLVLDPFVRMTGIDENSAQEVSRVLAYLLLRCTPNGRDPAFSLHVPWQADRGPRRPCRARRGRVLGVRRA